MWYLFWAHVICWLALLIYVYTLVRITGNLRKEIRVLKNGASEGREEKPDLLKQEAH